MVATVRAVVMPDTEAIAEVADIDQAASVADS